MKMIKKILRSFKKKHTSLIIKAAGVPSTSLAIFLDCDYLVNNEVMSFEYRASDLIKGLLKVSQGNNIKVSTRRPWVLSHILYPLTHSCVILERVGTRPHVFIPGTGTTTSNNFTGYTVTGGYTPYNIVLCTKKLKQLFNGIPQKLYITL